MGKPDESPIARFRCPECSRGLRVPEEAIGRRIGCPFCKTLYETSFAIVVDVEPVHVKSTEIVATVAQPTGNPLTRWIPSKGDLSTAAKRVAQTVKNGADRGIQTAQSAAAAVSSGAQNAAAAVGAGAKKAVAAATPVVTGLASVVLPGVGEVMSGKTTQGYCTMAAFFGATVAASAATGGAWIAVPVAIRIFSAVQSTQSGRQLGQRMKNSISDSNAEELQFLANEMRNQAASMSEQEFERLMLETEEAEMSEAESTSLRRVVLKRVVTEEQAD